MESPTRQTCYGFAWPLVPPWSAQNLRGIDGRALAILNNTAWGVFARQGETNLPHTQRAFAYQFDRALARLAS